MARFGLDIGSGGTVVCDTSGALLHDEPSVLLRQPRGDVVIGREAADLIDRVPSAAGAVRPVRGGVVTDLDTTRRYVRAVLCRVLPRPWQRTRLIAAVVVPACASALERRALIESVEEAGVTRTAAIAAPLAAAIGSGLDPLDRRVHMVVDAGAGTAEVMAFCCGEVLARRSTSGAGDALVETLRAHLRREHRLLTSVATAADLSERTSAAAESTEISVTGRDVEDSRPRTLRLPAAELHAVLEPRIAASAAVLSGCLDDLPARAVDDLASDGVLLVGGASAARGLRAALEAGLGLPVKQVENPTTCIAEGAARSLLLPGLQRAYAPD